MQTLETLFEKFLWSTRLLTLCAVIFGLVGAFTLFIVASVDVFGVAKDVIHIYANHLHPKDFHEMVVSGIIGAVDLYLIAIVMLIFSFGIYELFISDIDIAEGKKGSKILSITSLDALKDKLAKVIIMVLVVIFFKKAMYLEYKEALDLIYLSVSILAISLGLYFLGKIGKDKKENG
jgi:uncharacterized membrane protein YqhA